MMTRPLLKAEAWLRAWPTIALTLFPLACACACAACGGDDSGGSGGAGSPDAGVEAGQTGNPEAGPTVDGAQDGTTPTDATTPDATAPDATTPDGGTPDSGTTTGPEAADTGALATEPAYLRNDAIAGFSYTSNFGSPYDSILGAPLNTTQSAIAPGFQPQAAAGQIVASETFQLIASSADLYSALNISASLSVSTGLASVNAKTNFAQSTQIDSTDLWVLVDVSQTGMAQRIVGPTLTASAAALSPADFYALYGDRYAAEIVTGAEMFCTVQIHTNSEVDKSSLSVSLGFSYGASSASSSFASSAMSTIGSRNTTVTCKYLGFTPTTLVTDLPSLLNAAQAFQTGNAGMLGNVTTSTLDLLYTSYYGIPGYPGVPVGTDAKVAQQGQIATDYLLYNSLVNNDFSAYYADSTYSGLPFFTDMKSYRDSLSGFLTAAISNSQNPGVAVPTLASPGSITNWTVTNAITSMTGADPQYAVYGITNGIIPKRISDYAIPLRYAYPDASGNGTLKGTLFSPVLSVAAVSTAQPQSLTYPLYVVVNKTGTGTGPWLEYQWDTGTYFLSDVASSTGTPNVSAINTALGTFALAGDVTSQYVVVSKANGLVMTDNGANAMTATHFTSGANGGQMWEFYLEAGVTLNDCTGYVSPAAGATPGMGCTNGSNLIVTAANGANPPCGSMLYAISTLHTGYWEVNGSAIYANGGGGCDDCGYTCSGFHCPYSGCGGGPVPTDTFFLQPFDNDTSQAIYNYQGSNGGAVTYVVTDPTQTSPTSTTENVINGSYTINGNGNQLWLFIPYADVDQAP
jgi:hypothetical protein